MIECQWHVYGGTPMCLQKVQEDVGYMASCQRMPGSGLDLRTTMLSRGLPVVFVSLRF